MNEENRVIDAFDNIKVRWRTEVHPGLAVPQKDWEEIHAKRTEAEEKLELQVRTACEATARADSLDARLTESQAENEKLKAELRRRTGLLAEWQADWKQEPRTRLAFETEKALVGRG